MIYTKSFKSSFLYLIWIIFNYFIVITPIINWSSNKRRNWIIEKYFLVFRIVGVLTILQFICGGFGIVVPFFQNDSYKGIFRPALWFYEPSYLATYFSLYMGMSLVGFLYNKKKYKKDLILSWIVTMFTTSTTGFILIFISLIFLFILSKSIVKKIKLLFFTMTIISVLLGVISLININILKVFIGRLFTQGLTRSSGSRISTTFSALNLFKKHPILGIGADAYGNFTGKGAPVPNVSMEILINLGVVGGICFFYFFMYLYRLYKKKKNIIEVKMLWISLLLFIIILQANQNYLRLYMWIHIALFIGVVKNDKKEKNINNKIK